MPRGGAPRPGLLDAATAHTVSHPSKPQPQPHDADGLTHRAPRRYNYGPVSKQPESSSSEFIRPRSTGVRKRVFLPISFSAPRRQGLAISQGARLRSPPRSATAQADDFEPLTCPGSSKGLSLISFYNLVFFLKGTFISYQLQVHKIWTACPASGLRLGCAGHWGWAPRD